MNPKHHIGFLLGWHRPIRPLMTGLCALALGLGSGCSKAKPKPGTRVKCKCSYLTDFDDAARVDVDVCVPKGEAALASAKDCAGRDAHNHVEACTCGAPANACDANAADACKTN